MDVNVVMLFVGIARMAGVVAIAIELDRMASDTMLDAEISA